MALNTLTISPAPRSKHDPTSENETREIPNGLNLHQGANRIHFDRNQPVPAGLACVEAVSNRPHP